MKKFIPYILIALLTIAVFVLFFTSENNNARQFDGRITFRKKDKIPYGTFVAFESLKELFPGATILANKQEPGYWDSLSNYDAGQALIIVCPYFNASKYEIKKLIRFMEEGNDVFISAMKLSYEVTQLLKCDANSPDGLMYYFEQSEGSDRLSVSLTKPPFQKQSSYTYPGKRYDFYFYKLDTAVVTVLGHDKNNNPNFIHLKAGAGNLYVHLAPMVFSNYFLLHKNNIAYYENALSVISPNTTRVAWDEYYSIKKQERQKEPNWLSGFLKHPALKWALLTALFALLLYALLEMRRKQRYIPVIKKPGNDTLEFVKIIGRLYHDKSDHKNLCRKMSAYFLDHVRNRYKLPTSELNEDFEKNLHFKTGVGQEEISGIVSFIRQLDNSDVISDKQLAWFHKHLEIFIDNHNCFRMPRYPELNEGWRGVGVRSKSISMEEQIFQPRTDLTELNEAVMAIRREIKKVIVGQDEMIKLILAALLADGHVLIEGVPGVAKTLTARLVAQSINAGFSRIQFTPDLMPSDVLGTPVFNPKEAVFEFKKGPIFSNIVLVDEINRAPAKTQSALLEVMEERQASVDGKTYLMPAPFIVMATQNPVEQEGTYRLPEAQLDRFLFKIVVPYPSESEELSILTQFHHMGNTKVNEVVNPVLNGEQINNLRRQIKNILIEEKLLLFIAKLIHQTRNHKSIYLGASPRASLAVMNASKAIAAMQGRDFVVPEDIREVVIPILRHRIILAPDKEMEGVTEEEVIKQIIQAMDVPR